MLSTPGLAIFVISALFIGSYGEEWPVLYKKLSQRAPMNPACIPYVLKPICDGEVPMPTLPDNHSIEVHFLEHNILDIPLIMNIKQAGIGFIDLNDTTGNNKYSLTFSEYDSRDTSPLFPFTNGSKIPDWCNQGGPCFNHKIDDKFWNKASTKKISTIGGKIFNQLSEWVMTQNKSYSYYYPYTCRYSENISSQAWFMPWNSGSFTQAAFWHMFYSGAKFDTSQKPSYTTFDLYCEKPVSLGHEADLDQTVINELNKFYADFQPGFFHLLQGLIDLIEDELCALLKRPYYMYYNQQYWRLTLRDKCLNVGYNPVDLPQ